MPLIETSTLIDDALDYAVAICQGRTVKADPMAFCDGSYWVWEEVPSGRGGVDIYKSVYMRIGAPKGPGGTDKRFSPTTDWAQGGPIIDLLMREGLKMSGATCRYKTDKTSCQSSIRSIVQGGPTTLTATMRCYVAFVAGQTIEIPAPLMAS